MVILYKSYIWEKSCSWDIGLNALSQLDRQIFKSGISPYKIDKTASKNGFGQSGFWTWKLTVSQEWTDRIKLFFHAGTNSCKLKDYWTFWGWAWSESDCIWRMNRWNKLIVCILIQIYKNQKLIKNILRGHGMVKNGYGQSSHSTLKLHLME